MSLLSADNLRLVLDTMAEGVVLHDATGRIVWFNPSAARILGADQLAGLASEAPAWKAVRDDGTPLVADEHPAMVALRTGKPQRDVIIGLIHESAAKPTWISVNAEPVLQDGRPQSIVTSFSDVTSSREGSIRLRAVESQLRQSQKMEAIGHLTGGIAHDFNNLLTAIITNADLLGEQMKGGTEAREELDDLRRAARRGADLVRKLMVFSRRDRGELQRVDMADLLYDAARLLRRVVPESIKLETQMARDLPPIDGDPASLEQLLLNLATNARDAMPSGGTLRIQAERETLDQAACDALGWGSKPCECVLLTVTDTGTGMDANVLERVFDPFFTTKPVGAGTGLGMSIVYGVIQQHGGYIRIDSTPGRGTRIEMRFKGTDTALAPTEVERGEPRGGSEMVLLVEDNEAVRSAARRILEKSGYRVLSASTGVDALQLYQVQQRDIALVLADIVMPEMGGIELVEAIRRTGRSPRVLLTSGYTERTRDAERLGVPLLAKPWTPAQLARKVREVLDA